MKPERAIVPACLAVSVLWAAVLWNFSASGAELQQATAAPPSKVDQKSVSPDARRFLPGPLFAYWAGTERVFDGELSPATPRPFERGRLLPALDDDPKTTAFMRGAASVGPRALAWQLLELGSMHEIPGGAVLALNFRVDERDQKAEQGFVALTLPVEKLWLVPMVGIGAEADVAPDFVVGNELRSGRESPYGYALGFEASSWTHHRHRIMGKVGGVYRIAPRVALEERIALGVWGGPDVGGDAALQWITAGLQALSTRTTLYERVTLARSVAAPIEDQALETNAWSVDTACGLRHTISSTYGAVVQADFGSQPSRYQRFGLELTLYGTLF